MRETRVFPTAVGVVVVVAVDPAARGMALLPREERDLAASWGDRRRATFCAGRIALRAALVAAGIVVDERAVGPILRDDRGAPVLPPSLPRRLRASVTHKDTHAAAVVAVVDADDVHVGIDLECDEGQERGRIDGIARHALTPAEIAHLPVEDDDARRRAVLVRFSAKEALYKAIDKTLRRHVGFHEVGVVVDDERLSFACPQESNLRAEGLVVDVGMAGVVVTLCRAARMVAGAPA